MLENILPKVFRRNPESVKTTEDPESFIQINTCRPTSPEFIDYAVVSLRTTPVRNRTIIAGSEYYSISGQVSGDTTGIIEVSSRAIEGSGLFIGLRNRWREYMAQTRSVHLVVTEGRQADPSDEIQKIGFAETQFLDELEDRYLEQGKSNTLVIRAPHVTLDVRDAQVGVEGWRSDFGMTSAIGPVEPQNKIVVIYDKSFKTKKRKK